MGKRLNLPKIDLSRYNDTDLPPHVIDIIRNALIVYEGNVKKVSKQYNLSEDKISMIYEQHYLIISQIIHSKTRSEELDAGIDNAISLMTDHINELQSKKTTPIMRDHTVNNVNRITDRLIDLKKEFNNTFDTLVNQMNAQALKERQIRVLESGKPIDDSEYLLNQNTVANMLKQYTTNVMRQKKVILTNVKTGTHKVFEGEAPVVEAERFLACGSGHLKDISRQQKPYKGEWAIYYDDGREVYQTGQES